MATINGITLVPGLYRHTKSGGLYTVFGLVRHHETGKPMVVYYSHAHGSVSTRPLRGFEEERCSDPDGFEGRFVCITDRPGSDGQPPLDGISATVLWTSETLLRNFGLFEEALVLIAHAHSSDECLAETVATLEHALALVRKEQFERAASKVASDVGAAPNTSSGTMDPESSLGRL